MAIPSIKQYLERFSRNYQVKQVDWGFTDSPMRDAFGRARVSEPYTIFESQLQYNDLPLIWNTKTVGGGSTTHLPNESALSLDVGTASGDKVIRQTYEYFRYQSGKSQLVILTGVLGELKENLQARMGYFDDENGVFIEAQGSVVNLVIRSKTTGSVVENRIPSTQWNNDRLNGQKGQFNPSGLTLDPTKGQIFWIDLEWLSMGRVRCGIFQGGQMWKMHDFVHANEIDKPYMTTANLPLRYEIENTGTTASSSSLKQICGTVISEGGHNPIGVPFSADNDGVPVSVTTRRPILSIRPKATFNGITNRIKIDLEEAIAYSTGQPVYYEIIHGGTLTGASWSDVNTASSSVEFDTSATAISGGIKIHSDYLAASTTGNKSAGDVSGRSLTDVLPIALDIDGANPIGITIVATSLSTATDVYGSIHWIEEY